MDLGAALLRVDTVPRGRELEAWHRRLLVRRRAVRWTLLSAGALAACSPPLWRFARAHPVALPLTALVAAAPALTLYLAARSTIRGAARLHPRRVAGEDPAAEAMRRAAARAGAPPLGMRVYIAREAPIASMLGRRITVARDFLQHATEAELAAILAHEVGHWPHRFRIGLEVACALAWVLAVAALVSWAVPGATGLGVALFAVPAAAVTPFALLPTLAQARWHEHLADLHAARRVGASVVVAALLRMLDVLALRDDRALAELERESERETGSAKRAQLQTWLAFWRTLRTAPTLVSWREFDANGNGIAEPDEQLALVAALAPWPHLHLDVVPHHAGSTHPGTLERILFLLREAEDRGSPGLPRSGAPATVRPCPSA